MKPKISKRHRCDRAVLGDRMSLSRSGVEAVVLPEPFPKARIASLHVGQVLHEVGRPAGMPGMHHEMNVPRNPVEVAVALVHTRGDIHSHRRDHESK